MNAAHTQFLCVVHIRSCGRGRREQRAGAAAVLYGECVPFRDLSG